MEINILGQLENLQIPKKHPKNMFIKWDTFLKYQIVQLKIRLNPNWRTIWPSVLWGIKGRFWSKVLLLIHQFLLTIMLCYDVMTSLRRSSDETNVTQIYLIRRLKYKHDYMTDTIRPTKIIDALQFLVL